MVAPRSDSGALAHHPRRARTSAIDLGEDLADDLRHLVRRQYVTAFVVGHFGREVLDGMDTPDEDVAQRLGAGVGIVQLLDRVGDVDIGVGGYLVWWWFSSASTCRYEPGRFW